MNFILTSLWLIGMTYLGYWIGEQNDSEYSILIALIFLIMALIIRFVPKAFSDGADFVGSIID